MFIEKQLAMNLHPVGVILGGGKVWRLAETARNKKGNAMQSRTSGVKAGRQNISVKFSPADFNLELITNFSVNKTFEEAFSQSETVTLEKNGKTLIWRVISLDDLIVSKLKSGRPKDLLDVQQLQRKNRE